MPSHSTPLLRIHRLHKSFSGIPVLRDLSLSIQPGEIRGLIGENGAGKSTLIRILCGIHAPDSGRIEWKGREVSIPHPGEAIGLGINLVPQELNLAWDLSVSANIHLGKEHLKGMRLDHAGMRKKSESILRTLQIPISPDALVHSLSAGQKQMVEIARALSHQSSLLILDEPTSALSQVEADLLFDRIQQLSRDGVAILLVSHRLRDIKNNCHQVTILRDGILCHDGPVPELTESDMASKMVGREKGALFPKHAPAHPEIVLSVQNLCGESGLHDITFHLHKGEILGFAGLIGSGRTELAETLMGLRRLHSGHIRVRDADYLPEDIREAVRHRLAYLSEDRGGKGVFPDWKMTPNITLVSLPRYTQTWIHSDREQQVAHTYVDRLGIHAGSLDLPLRSFSGGNQQKVYLSRWLDTHPEILILDEPTRGVDIDARRDFYRVLCELAASGISIIVISSEMEEVLGLCHRIYVMHQGSIQGCLGEKEMSEEQIMQLAVGLTPS